MAFFPGTSVVQWGPGAPMGLVQCLPYICPILPKGWLEEVRGSHPQGQLGGWQGLLGEGQEGSMVCVQGREGISSLAGPAHLWPHCLSHGGEGGLGGGMEWGCH